MRKPTITLAFDEHRKRKEVGLWFGLGNPKANEISHMLLKRGAYKITTFAMHDFESNNSRVPFRRVPTFIVGTKSA